MKSVMNHTFSQVPRAEIQRSQFDRSHGFKTTLNVNYLYPIFVDEALPGDTFNCSATIFARLATPIVPIMDNLFADTFFFAVPMRLVWDNFQRFMGEQANPLDSVDFLIPQMTAPVGGYANGTLSDYFGLPTKVAGYSHSALWHRAYNLIWNQWFRDENLQNSVPVPKGDGPDTPGDYVLLRRGKRHDYFTSALPWPQKGPAVALPLGTSAPVYGQVVGNSGDGNLWQTWDPTAVARKTGSLNLNANASDTGRTVYGGGTLGATNIVNKLSLGSKDQYDAAPTNDPPYADLAAATGATINALRQAFQLQRLYERDARGGTRYTEIIKAHFGVTSPDARLQRPEYLGGNSTPITINPVAQTSAAAGQPTPQGNLAGIGTLTARNAGFVKSFTEHTLLIGMIAIRADLNYQEGLNRMWSRRTKYDLYWPALAHLGEQAILNKEIYTQGTSADEQVFGYQERYAEYRYKPSLVTGLFRSNDAASLDFWHLSQEFGGLPSLNFSFIQEDVPLSRAIAVPSQPQFLLDSYFQLKCARPMPTYSVPGLIDHF